MEFLKKANALVLGLAILLAVGCGGDEPEPDNSNNQVSKDCVITAFENIGFGDTTRVEFEFDSQNRFIRLNYLVNGVLQNVYRLVEYDNSGRISKISYQGGVANSNQNGDYQLYSYNATGLITRQDYYDVENGQANLVSYLTFTYDSNNNLIRKDGFVVGQTTILQAYSLYSYSSANTAREEKYSLEIPGAPLKHIRTKNYAFDNKIGVQQLLGPLWEEGTLSPHNILREESISPTPGNPPSINTYSYQYNSEGFPIVTERYFNGGSLEIMNFTYNCQ